MTTYDIFICGAGPVGTTLALALSHLPLNIYINDANSLKTEITNIEDGRSIALTLGSMQILQSIGVWSTLRAFASAIDKVHVSERGRFGATRINAKDEKVPALGYVVPAELLWVTLNKLLLQQVHASKIMLMEAAKVTQMVKVAEGWEIILQTGETTRKIHSRLVVAADGTHSTIRTLQNIAVQEKDYEQSAISTTVKLQQLHQNVAYERFLKEGAIALLPLMNERSALIWTATHQKIKELISLSDTDFLAQVQEVFGYRLGRFQSVTKRYTFPLKMLFAPEQVREGLVLLGNAAHTIHPIAAQGFNLGLSDVAALAEIINEAVDRQEDFSSLASLEKYQQLQKPRQEKIIHFTDKLTRVFSQDFLLFNLMRSGAFLALDIFPSLKRRLSKPLIGASFVEITHEKL